MNWEFVLDDINKLESERKGILNIHSNSRHQENNRNDRSYSEKDNKEKLKKFLDRYLNLQNELKMKGKNRIIGEIDKIINRPSFNFSQDKPKPQHYSITKQINSFDPKPPENNIPSKLLNHKSISKKLRKSFIVKPTDIDQPDEIDSKEICNKPIEFEKQIISYIIAFTYCNLLSQKMNHEKYAILKLNQSAKIITEGFRKHVAKVISKRYKIAVTLSFRLSIRIQLKHKAANRVKVFFNEFNSSTKSSFLIRKFLIKIRKIQRAVKGFIAITRARVILVKLYWEKIESNIRDIRNEAANKQLQEDKKNSELIINKLLLNKSGVAMRWKALNKKVVLYGQKISDIRAKFRKYNLSNSHRQNLFDVNENKDQDFQLDDRVPESIRNTIIINTLHMKRKMHKMNIALIKDPSKHLNLIDENIIRDFLGGNDTAAEKISKLQLSAAEIIKNKFQKINFSQFETLFLCLTGNNLGKSWKAIIKDAVDQDFADKSA